MDNDSRPEGDGQSTPSPAAQVSGSQGRLIDWKKAREATAYDEELLADVIGAFREEAPTLLASIREAIENRDAVILHRAAHTIKNAFYSLGAQTTGDISFELEQAGEAAEFQRSPALLKTLEEEFRQVLQEIDDYMAERGPACE